MERSNSQHGKVDFVKFGSERVKGLPFPSYDKSAAKILNIFCQKIEKCCHYVFKKPSAEASESVYMRERVKRILYTPSEE